MVLLKNRGKGQGARGKKARLTSYVSRLTVFIFVAHFTFLIPDVSAEEKIYRINIEGMHCNMCVYRVNKSLKKLKQVKEVEVDLDSGTATVTLNDGMDLKPEELEEAVEDSGYKPNGVEVVGANGHSPDKEEEVGK